MRLHDVRGWLVRAAITGKEMPAGKRRWIRDGRDENGARVGPGVYFHRLIGAGETRTSRAVILL